MSRDTDPVLKVDNLAVTYNGGAQAVQGVSLAVHRGEIVGIVGINGAGKTTLLSAIAGFLSGDIVRITGGSVIFAERECSRLRPDAISSLGLALVPEREKVFFRMTVRENLLASELDRSKTITQDMIFEFFPRLAEKQDTVAGYLSGGERQMLAISMAMLSNPSVLMIDELSLGLAPAIIETLIGTVKSLCKTFNLSLLFVEQNAASALSLANYVYVMDSGRFSMEGRPGDLRLNQKFRDSYLGLGHGSERRSFRQLPKESRPCRI
jgi:branched-chain amino acid transport system ATP-binding protein